MEIRAKDWGWRHASRRAWALRNLSFTIKAGERVLLLGASGAGKSTLLAALAGVLGDANEGEEEGLLTIGGTHPRELKGHAALMMQDPDSQIVLTRVGDDVAFGCENMCIPPDEIWPRVDTALKSVGLDLPRDHHTNHLSGGEQQRLVLAGALAMGAELLVLDEPTANLDTVGLIQVRDAVAEVVADRNRTLIVVEHHCSTWASLVDRVIVLAPDGAIADGSPTQIFPKMSEELAAMGVWIPGEYMNSGSLPFNAHPVRTITSQNPTGTDTSSGSCEVSIQFDPEIPTQVHKPKDGHHIEGDVVKFRDERGLDGSDSGYRPVAISTHGLAIGYGSTPIRTGISIDIPRGLSSVITGTNGSGKTTLALTLAGLLPPLDGVVEVAETLAPNGRSSPHTWRSRELLTRIGTVFQSPDHQFVASTVFDEIAVGLKALSTKRSRARSSHSLRRPESVPDAQTIESTPTSIDATVNQLLDQLRLTHLAKANPFTLSGGEKRRLSVATVLACNPQVIILDEPTFGQDRLTWASMVEIVATLRDQGTTIISVTHDQAYIEALADHRIDMGEL